MGEHTVAGTRAFKTKDPHRYHIYSSATQRARELAPALLPFTRKSDEKQKFRLHPTGLQILYLPSSRLKKEPGFRDRDITGLIDGEVYMTEASS